MAGWDDIEVDGQSLGELEPGYIIDIKLINTYIKAYNEKANIVEVPRIDPIVTEIDIPEEDQEEPTPENPNPPTTMDAGPYIWNYSKLTELVQGYGRLMNNITWVKESVFLDPLSVDSVYITQTGQFVEADFILLIGQLNYDILSDPFDDWRLKDIQSASMLNAMYKLYSEVFIYVERDSIPNSRWSLKRHSIKDGLSATPHKSDFIPRTGQNEFFKVEDFLNVSFKNTYENLEFAEEVDNRRQVNFSINDSQTARINTGDANDPGGTDMSYSAQASINQRIFNTVLHTFVNDEGDFVELEFSCAGYVTNNHIEDSTTPVETEQITISSFDNGYPQVVGVQQNYVRIKWPDLVNSEITDDGWLFHTILENHHEYGIETGEFIYDFADIPPRPSNPNDTRKAILKKLLLSLKTGDSPIDGKRQDYYYNTNVEAMIYNTLPDEEEEP